MTILLRETSTDWFDNSCTSPGAKPAKQITTLFGSSPAVHKVEYDYGGFAKNLIETREYDLDGSLARRTTTVWMEKNPISGTNYITDKLYMTDRKLSESVYDGSGNLVALTKFAYDGELLAAGTSAQKWPGTSGTYLTRGNQTSVQKWINTSNSWIETRSLYDTSGNVVKQFDAKGSRNRPTYRPVHVDVLRCRECLATRCS